MAAGVAMAQDRGAAGDMVPAPRRYRLVDRATGEEYEVDSATLERILGIEAGYVDWAIAEDGRFENGRWRVR